MQCSYLYILRLHTKNNLQNEIIKTRRWSYPNYDILKFFNVLTITDLHCGVVIQLFNLLPEVPQHHTIFLLSSQTKGLGNRLHLFLAFLFRRCINLLDGLFLVFLCRLSSVALFFFFLDGIPFRFSIRLVTTYGVAIELRETSSTPITAMAFLILSRSTRLLRGASMLFVLAKYNNNV